MNRRDIVAASVYAMLKGGCLSLPAKDTLIMMTYVICNIKQKCVLDVIEQWTSDESVAKTRTQINLKQYFTVYSIPYTLYNNNLQLTL